MGTNPVEDNFVTRFLLGFAVIIAMLLGGQVIGAAFLSVGVPYGDWLGVAVGAILVFGVFTAGYRRYDASWNTG